MWGVKSIHRRLIKPAHQLKKISGRNNVQYKGGNNSRSTSWELFTGDVTINSTSSWIFYFYCYTLMQDYMQNTIYLKTSSSINQNHSPSQRQWKRGREEPQSPNILEGKLVQAVYASEWARCVWSFSIRMEMGPANSSDTDLSPRTWMVSLKGCRAAFQPDPSRALA